ncbi:MAG: M15 family metallopeptidase [Synergistaceae bacterium]|nr:M15 family metallopeptidase [Synergistaceae bacterium]MBQ9573889.1 M15 family metallopeptidase [Synergistaceae bacterium]
MEHNEKLIPASMYPERILTRSFYFTERLPGSYPEIWVRESVYERLLVAAESLPEGLRLIIWDGWRSFELQTYLYSTLFGRIKAEGFSDDEAHKRTKIFVAYPSKDDDNVSAHLTGGAVDLTLADKYGHYLPMGGDFDDTGDHSRTDYYDNDIPENYIPRWNRKTLYRVMTQAGFTNYESEWWHYDLGDRNWAMRKGTEEVYGYIEPHFKWKE